MRGGYSAEKRVLDGRVSPSLSVLPISASYGYEEANALFQSWEGRI